MLELAVGVFLSAVASVVPATLYALLLWWCDRYEREPLGLVVATFAWGAGPAIILALVWEMWLGTPLAGPSPSLAMELLSTSGLVPLVEEVVKALALVGMLFFFRQEFDSVLDGIVYGGLVGFGFGMTENFFYYLQAFESSGLGYWATVVFLRGLVFGLNHAFYSALVGAGLGYARERNFRRGSVGMAALGFAAAIVFHGMHNLGSTLASLTLCGLGISLLNDAGGVAVVVAVLILSLRRERACIAEELTAEVGRSLSEGEYAYLISENRALVRLRWPFSRRARWAALMSELAFKRRQARQSGRDPEDDPAVQKIRRKIAPLRDAIPAG